MDMPGNLEQTDFGTIDRYDRLGRVLPEDERKKIAKARGLCYPCGRQTHEKRRFMMSNLALTDDDVYQGICIKCHPGSVPKDVLEAWEKRNKPQRATGNLAHHVTNLMNVQRAARKPRSVSAGTSQHSQNQYGSADNRPRHLSDRTVDHKHGSTDSRPRHQSDRSAMRAGGSDRSMEKEKSGNTMRHGGSDRGMEKEKSGNTMSHGRSDPLVGHLPGSATAAKLEKLETMPEKKRSSSGKKVASHTRRPSDASTSSRQHDDMNSSASSLTGKKKASSSHRKKTSRKLLDDGSERSMSSGQFYEDQQDALDRSDRSRRPSNGRAGNRSVREDWLFHRLALPPEEIAKQLDENMHDAVKLRSTLHSLRNEYEGGHEILLDTVNQVMKEYESETRILDVACGAIWRMAADDVAAKRGTVDSGSINLVIEALGKCHYDPDFSEWAMGTIMSVATEVEYKDYVSQKNAIESILDTLKDHKDRAGVFEWSCRCLYTLLVVHQDGEEDAQPHDILYRNISSIEDFNGIPTIIEAMKVHDRECRAQQVAVDLLWRLLDVVDKTATNTIVRKFIQAGFVPLATRLLKLQSTSAELSDRVAELLCFILSADKADSSLVASVIDCVPPVIRRMKTAPKDERMQKAGLRVLVAVTVLGDVPAQTLQDSSASDAVIEATKLLLSDPKSVASGLLILWKLSTYKPCLLDRRCVVAALEVMKGAISLESYCLENHAAILGFIANVSGTPGLKISDLPLRTLFDSEFDDGAETSEKTARLIASEVMPFICVNFPEFGNEAVRYMADEDFLSHLQDGSFDKVFPLAQTIMAVGTKARLDLPPGLTASVVGALTKTSNPAVQKILINFLVSSVIASSDGNAVPPTTIQTLVNLFRQHQHELDLCQSILNAMAHIFLLSPAGVDCRVVARSILDYVLSPSVTDDTEEEASIALWSLLAKNPCDDTDTLSRIYSYAVKVFERFVGDSAEAFDSSLVETTCGVLSSVASLVRSAPIAVSQSDVDTIVSIVYLSMEMERSPATPCLVLEALYHFCLLNEAVLIQCGAIVVVADAIQKFNTNPRVLGVGFAVLAQLASSENVHINLSIVFSDGVDSLLHGMNLFPEERDIQLEGCKAFSHLSIEGETRMVICEQGGISLIVLALDTHEGDEVLVEYGCSALLNLTSDSPDHVLDGSGIIPSIVRLLEKYQGIASIRRNCLGILQNLSMKGAHAKDNIARCGGLVAVINSLKQQEDSSDVLERAFTTLWSLAVLGENRERIRHAGGIEHAVTAMLSFVEYEGVQQQACGCICTLAMDPTVCSAIRASGGCLALLYAMRVHYTSPEVQSEAARAFSVMYGADNLDGGLEPSSEEVDAVLMAMRRFSDDETLQTRGCSALSAFLMHDHGPFVSLFGEIQRLARKASTNFPALGPAADQVESLTR